MTLDLRRFLLLVIDTLVLRPQGHDAIPDLAQLTLPLSALRDLNLPPEIAARFEVHRQFEDFRRRPFA